MMGHWIEWHGGECPVDRDEHVRIKHRGGFDSLVTVLAKHVDWSHRPSPLNRGDIIAYRIISDRTMADTKTLAWEKLRFLANLPGYRDDHDYGRACIVGPMALTFGDLRALVDRDQNMVGKMVPQWRCINCKNVVRGHLKPDNCPYCKWCVGFAEIATPSPPSSMGEKRTAITPEWCVKMAGLEDGYEVGAGMLHPGASPPPSLAEIGQGTRERIARCIIGPRNPVPAESRYTLTELRENRWWSVTAGERSDAFWAADAILATLTPDPAQNTCEMPEVTAIRYLNELREPCGASVTILCDDEEAWTRDKQMAIDIQSDWTDWDTQRFFGESILQCAAKAITARDETSPPTGDRR